MFDFAWSHFLLLFIVAVLLLGPQELPTVLRFIGKWAGKLRQHHEEFHTYLKAVTEESINEKKDDSHG